MGNAKSLAASAAASVLQDARRRGDKASAEAGRETHLRETDSHSLGGHVRPVSLSHSLPDSLSASLAGSRVSISRAKAGEREREINLSDRV